jgi:hypothetical protein
MCIAAPGPEAQPFWYALNLLFDRELQHEGIPNWNWRNARVQDRVCSQQQNSVGEQMRRIVKLAATLTAEEMQDRLELLSAWD